MKKMEGEGRSSRREDDQEEVKPRIKEEVQEVKKNKAVKEKSGG